MATPKVSLSAVQREIGLRGSLYDFIKMAWPIVEPGTTFVENWHIKAVCDHLEAVYNRDIRKLGISVPPGSMKSLTTCVFWPVWVWIRDPGARFLFGSFDAKLTRDHAAKSKSLILSDWFRARWGDVFKVDPKAPVGHMKNSKGGFRFATSVGGTGTGRHVDFIVIDDPLKPKDAASEIALESVHTWWRGTLSSRMRDAAMGCKVVIMQRLHENDLVGYTQAHETGWEYLVLPMRAEVPCQTSIFTDPRQPGELLCPARWSEETVAALEKDMGSRVAAAQLQQRPSPESGGIFQRAWLEKTWDELPTRFDSMLQSWDCTFKDTDGSDYVVGQVWGRKGADFYLLDQKRARMSFPATLDAIRAMTKKWPKARTKLIEDKANGPAVAATLQREMVGIITVNPEGGKVARANAVAPIYESGNVLLPAGQNWLGMYRDELASFPVGAHDDQVDASTQALNYMLSKTSRFAEAMRVARKGMLRSY